MAEFKIWARVLAAASFSRCFELFKCLLNGAWASTSTTAKFGMSSSEVTAEVYTELKIYSAVPSASKSTTDTMRRRNVLEDIIIVHLDLIVLNQYMLSALLRTRFNAQ